MPIPSAKLKVVQSDLSNNDFVLDSLVESISAKMIASDLTETQINHLKGQLNKIPNVLNTSRVATKIALKMIHQVISAIREPLTTAPQPSQVVLELIKDVLSGLDSEFDLLIHDDKVKQDVVLWKSISSRTNELLEESDSFYDQLATLSPYDGVLPEVVSVLDVVAAYFELDLVNVDDVGLYSLVTKSRKLTDGLLNGYSIVMRELCNFDNPTLFNNLIIGIVETVKATSINCVGNEDRVRLI